MIRPISYRSVVPMLCAMLSFAGAAAAQTISTDTTSLMFTVASGGFATKQVNVTTTASTTIFINTTGIPSWMTVSPSGPLNIFTGGPTVINVTANAAGVNSGMNLTGSFTVGIESSNSTPITINVGLSVMGTSALSASVPSLSFSAAAGTSANNIPTQSFVISSSTTSLNYSITAATQDGNNWLVPVTVSGNTGNGGNATVGVNPGNLPSGVYHGTIFITSLSSTDTTSVAVTMTLSTPATISVTPATLSEVLYQTGTTAQSGQLTRTLMVSSSGSSTPFVVSAVPAAPWLIISPPNGATGTGGAAVPITLTVNPSGLTPAVYTTNIFVTGPGQTPPPNSGIQLQVVISNNPLLQVSNNQLAFKANLGDTTSPPSQSVQVTTLGTGSDSFTFASDSPWLSATASSGSTPATLTISVSPVGLAVNNYTGTITVRPTGADANLYSVPITVSFSIGTTTTLSAGPPLLVFGDEIGLGAPISQIVQVSAVGQPVSFFFTATSMQTANCPANWLSAESLQNVVASTAPVTLTVGVTTAGMTSGTCSGSVVVTYPATGPNQTNLTIPVTVNVSASAVLTVNMPLGFGLFSFPQNSAPQFSSITLGSTDGSAVPFSVAATSNGPTPWLFVGANGTSTPQSLQVQLVPGTLPPNTYSGTITITSPNLPQSPLNIPVTLTISSSVTVTLSNPGPLNFSQPAGGPAPAPQSITLTSSGGTGASFQVTIPNTAACSWLHVSPMSGAASGSVTFTPQANSLAQNTYTCPVTFSFINSASAPVIVNAILTVGAAQTVSASVPSLAFAYQFGGTTPAPQALTISSTGGAVNFTVGTTSNGGWLATDAGSGTLATPKTFNVTINPANIPSGALGGQVLNGTVTISAPGVLATPLSIPVSLTLSAAAVPGVVTILNSGSNSAIFSVAPGQLITIKGTNLGPASPAGGTSFAVNGNGTVNSTLAGTQVMFDNTPGTPTFVSQAQINVIVPWEVAGRATTNIVVIANGISSASTTFGVTNVSPSVFTLQATGQGQAAAIDDDNGHINGPVAGVPVGGGTIATTPAAALSYISVYGTGGGVTTPPGTDGTLNSGIILMPLLNWTSGSSIVTATIGGKPANVGFAGAAPTLITGVWQVNVQIPAGLASGPQPLLITIDGQQTQSNVTIAVQ